MATIIHPALVDTRKVAKAIKDWFDLKGFETKALEVSGSYCVKARKSSTVRSVFGADRAMEVEVRQNNGQTIVDVRQGSWKTNVISNVAWLIATGGMNLAFTGWSVVIQKELESHIRSVLADLGGVHEVDLTIESTVQRDKQHSDISFYCIKCGQHIVIDKGGAGLQVNCPSCQDVLIVPKTA